MSVAYLFRAAKARTDGPCHFLDHRDSDELPMHALTFRVRLKPKLSSTARTMASQESCHRPDAEICLNFV